MERIIKTCKHIVRDLGALRSCIKGVNSTKEEIGDETSTLDERSKSIVMFASDLGDSSSQVVTSRVDYEIEKSTEHWTQMPSKSTVNHPVSSEEGPLHMANREKFNHLMEQWYSPNSEYGFFLDYEDRLEMGPKIAEGGQAEIFDAKFVGDDREFVLKVFKEDISLADLERWWPPTMLPLLRDDYEPPWMRWEPHCCWMRGGTLLSNGRFAFLMNKYPCDLRTFIDRRTSTFGPTMFHYPDIIDIILQIARGMKSLHNHGILHRDLKASNVLIGNFYISSVDFVVPTGLLVADFESSAGADGTRFWRAPEVLLALKNRNRRPEMFTEKADVYSYAMTCYEVVTGKTPLVNLKQNDYDAVINGARPQLPDYLKDTYLEALFRTWWHSDPSMRPDFNDIVNTLAEHQSYLYELSRDERVAYLAFMV